MLPRQNSIDYLKRLSNDARRRQREATVSAAILEKGYWEEHEEWRISTVTTLRIEPVDKDGTRWSKVTVSCDASMTAHCPTIDRAIEFAGMFERLHQDLFWTVGWPSWASPDQLKP